jgi:UDP-N-acetylmuramate dehydrogenase
LTQPWVDKALKSLPGVKLTPDLPLAQHTTFKIGGPLDLLAEPTNEEQLRRVLDFCEQAGLPWMALGLGSNLLVREQGIRGIGIRLAGAFLEWRRDGTIVHSGAGVTLADLAKETACLGLSGLEFACGIPGTVGGAVYMNAGAYDGEMAQVIIGVEAVPPGRGKVTYSAAEAGFEYRKSRFQAEKAIITAVSFQLCPVDAALAAARINEFTCRRESRQPLEWPSAGSVFRRPEGHFVGPLIEAAGLKGLAVGGARVSPKHAGFIVNDGNATASDVLELVEHVQKVIAERNGIELQLEIRVVGEA